MKITLDKKDLLESLKLLALSLGAKKDTVRPIYQQIKIECFKNKTLFMTTNGESYTIKGIKTDSDLPGSCTCDGHKLISLVDNLKKDTPITLYLNDKEHLVVKQGRSSCKLNSFRVESFPVGKFFKEEEYFPMDPQELAKAISSVIYCVNPDEFNRPITGVLIEPFKEGMIRVVGTDGRRLAAYAAPGVINESFIIPFETANNLMKLCEKSENLGMLIEEGMLYILLDDGVFNCRLIAKEYPDYRRLFPSNKDTVLVFDREEMVSACKRIRLFGGKDERVSFLIKKDKVVLEGREHNAEMTEEVELREGSNVHSDIDMSFNPSYLFDTCKNLKEKEVHMMVYGARSPVVFSEKNVTKLVCPRI